MNDNKLNDGIVRNNNIENTLESNSNQSLSQNQNQSQIQIQHTSHQTHMHNQQYQEQQTENLFLNIDKAILTLFNEPSLGLYFTQQHIQNSFSTLLFNMDKLHDNRKTINNTILDINNTEQEIKEISSLNEDFSFKMLARINSLNFELQRKKN